MAKMYNILKDENAIRTILETLGDLCRIRENCRYCPFHEGRYCMLAVNGRVPMQYFEEDED